MLGIGKLKKPYKIQTVVNERNQPGFGEEEKISGTGGYKPDGNGGLYIITVMLHTHGGRS